jgi:hypothetical protein
VKNLYIKGDSQASCSLSKNIKHIVKDTIESSLGNGKGCRRRKTMDLIIILASFFLFIGFFELLLDVNPQNALAIEKNIHQVSITITNPPTKNQTILTNFITINGTTTSSSSSSSSSDSGSSGIKQVDVLFSKLPFTDTVRM